MSRRSIARLKPMRSNQEHSRNSNSCKTHCDLLCLFHPRLGWIQVLIWGPLLCLVIPSPVLGLHGWVYLTPGLHLPCFPRPWLKLTSRVFCSLLLQGPLLSWPNLQVSKSCTLLKGKLFKPKLFFPSHQIHFPKALINLSMSPPPSHGLPSEVNINTVQKRIF